MFLDTLVLVVKVTGRVLFGLRIANIGKYV